MDRQVQHMVRLIDDLLDVSRITRNKLVLRREQIELAAAMQSGLESSRPLLEAAGLMVSVDIPVEPIYLDADLTRLAQVLANLLNNAAKFTERGGCVKLSAKRQGETAVIRVSDTGVGIPREMLPRVFDMFTQVERSIDRTRDGLGIGLTLVKRLVEQHGGTVEAHSEGPGYGSEFIIKLPVISSLPSISSIEPSIDVNGTNNHPGRRIVLADDNLDAAASLGMLLELLGHDVKTANDGFEALNAVESSRPELVLLDIGMPRMSGYEVAQRIREQSWGQEMVLIALTGWGQEEDKRRSFEAGFDHHLTKPVDPAELEKLVRGSWKSEVLSSR